jgi:hypothetical protein
MFFWFSLYIQRLKMIAYAVLAGAVAVAATLPAALTWVDGRWRIVHARPDQVAHYWENGVDNAIMGLLVIMLFCAADLGATALGDDSARRGMEFVLTRPRPRARLMWTAWSASLVEVGVLALAGTVTSALVLWCVSGALLPAFMVQLLVALLAAPAAMMSVAFCLTVGTRSARSGYQLAALALFALGLLRFLWYGREIYYYQRFSPHFWLVESASGHAVAERTLLLLVAAALPFAAVFAFERREV